MAIIDWFSRYVISMDGRGRVFDNIFVERFWRSVKYENVYLHGYQTIPETWEGLGSYFEFFNNGRFHQALDYKTPLEMHSGVYSLPVAPVKQKTWLARHP